MNTQEIIKCRTCNQKLEFLDSELIKLPYIKEGAAIGTGTYKNAVNILLYCNQCKVNQSKPYCYEDKKIVPMFIADIKAASTEFSDRSYNEI